MTSTRTQCTVVVVVGATVVVGTSFRQISFPDTFLQTRGFFLVPAIAPDFEQLLPTFVAETDVVGKARCNREIHKTSTRTLFLITPSHYLAPASLEFLYLPALQELLVE